jgi:hypothetical protein
MPRSASKKLWSFKAGRRPYRVSVEERADKGLVVYAMYRFDGQKQKVSLNMVVRDENGNEDPNLIHSASTIAKAMQQKLEMGQDPATALPSRVQAVPSPSLGLVDGIRTAYQAPGIEYTVDSPYVQDMRRAALPFGEAMAVFAQSWVDIRPQHYRDAWNRIIASIPDEGAKTKGLRTLELGVQAFLRAGRILYNHDKLTADFKRPPTNWKERLREDWADKFTGGDVQALEPNRPRYTREELAALARASASPEVDPRVGLAFELGYEARLGQVGRCMWSDISPLPNNPNEWKLRVPGKKKKHGPTILLSRQQRSRLVKAMSSGYLVDLEAARVKGRIKDYPLFPAGRLRGGKAPIAPMPKAMSDRYLHSLFRKLEERAGVEHQDGRAWYGARRKAVDLVAVGTANEDTKNSISGHKDSATRAIYRSKDSPELLKASRAARLAGRKRAGAAAGSKRGNRR